MLHVGERLASTHLYTNAEIMEYDKIIKALRQKDLSGTFPAVKEMAEALGDWELKEKVNDLWDTYSHMLVFMTQGFCDTQSEHIRDSICEQLLAVTYVMRQLQRVKECPTGIYAVSFKHKKEMQSLEAAISSLERKCQEIADVEKSQIIEDGLKKGQLDTLYVAKDKVLRSIFNYVWTSTIWDNVDVDQANRLLFSDIATTNDKCVFVSAVMLSLIDVPDKAKLLLLLDCSLMEDTLISQHALTGFILAYNAHSDVYDNVQEVRERLDIYQEDSDFIRDFCATMMQLQMTATTESANHKIKDNIMPLFMQQSKKMGDSGSVIDISRLVKHGENPEWADKKMNKAMDDMSNMMQEGVDIHFSSFSNYKNGQFFSRLPHWFYLFSLDYLEHLYGNEFPGIKDGLMNIFISTGQFCDSDKYSMCYMYAQIAGLDASLTGKMKEQMGEEIAQLKMMMEHHGTKPMSKSHARRSCIQGLYRFYMCNPYRSEFVNPLSSLKTSPLSPLSNEWIGRLMASCHDEVAQYADFLMRNEFYDEALCIFMTIATNEFDEALAGVWQKVGFCHQKLGHQTEAVRAYTIANNIKPNSKWTISHLAAMSLNAEDWSNVYEYNKQLYEMENDNPKYMMQMIKALHQMSRYDESLPLLFKANYLADDSATRILLAYTLIALDRTDDAVAELMKVQSGDASTLQKAELLKGVCSMLKKDIHAAFVLCKKNYTSDTDAYVADCLKMLVGRKMLEKQTVILFMDALRLDMPPGVC